MCLISNAGSRRVCDRVRVCVAFAFGLPSLDPFSASAKPRDPITNRHRNSVILPLVTLERNAIITRSARPDVQTSFWYATRCVVRYESRLRFPLPRRVDFSTHFRSTRRDRRRSWRTRGVCRCINARWSLLASEKKGGGSCGRGGDVESSGCAGNWYLGWGFPIPRSVLALRMRNESARSVAADRIIVYRKNMNKLSNFRRFVTFRREAGW